MDIEKITDPLYKNRAPENGHRVAQNEEELSVAERRSSVNPCDAEMSVEHQCELWH